MKIKPGYLIFGLGGLLLAASPARAQVKFRHIVIIDQENRTPDNLFGSNPTFEAGVDIQTYGYNSKGVLVTLRPAPLTSCWDMNHSHSGFVNQLKKGADQTGNSNPAGCTVPTQPGFSYVDNSTGAVQPYFDIATNYGFANYMFQSNEGPSFPSHQFLFGGTSAPSAESSLFMAENMGNTALSAGAGCTAIASQTVNLIDGSGSEATNAPIFPCAEHNTMGDVLDAAHLSWRYYASNAIGGIWNAPMAIRHLCVPVTVKGQASCTGADFNTGDVPANDAQVLTDIASCALPAVSWVIPTAAESDHSAINNGTGPQWVASIVNAVGQQPNCASGENYWNDTAIFITWDDWGGWFDHVTPFSINFTPYSPPGWGDGYTFGFRVPLLVVSAYTPARYVDNVVHDFGSILQFIEQNFNLPYIGPGDTAYSNYADYQAAARGDSLYGFFSLTTPRPYTAIAARLNAAYFLKLPPSRQPPDDE